MKMHLNGIKFHLTPRDFTDLIEFSMNNGIFRPQLMKLGMVKGQVFAFATGPCSCYKVIYPLLRAFY